MSTEKDLKEIVAKRIELFKRNPAAAQYRPRVTSRHVNGLYTEGMAREHMVKSDYAVPAGGSNLGPNPIELLLSAFAACIEAAFHEFAEAEGIPVRSVSAEVEGSLDLRGLFMVDDRVRPGFNDLKYVLKIETEGDPEKTADLARRVVAHCPVVDSLVNPVQVSGEICVSKAS